MNLRENPHSVYSSRQNGLVNAPSPEYKYEYDQVGISLPVIPVAARKPINLQEKYAFEGVQPEYYTLITPIDRAYQISRVTNCMGGAPRLPGLLPCPYGTDAIACAYHAA